MKNIFLLFFSALMFTSFAGYAQIINDSGGHSRMLLQTKKNDDFRTKLVGSPFLNDNFEAGTVKIDGKDPVRVFLRYDVLNEDMEIKPERSSEDIFLLPVAKSTEYTIGEDKFSHTTLNHNGKSIKGYFREHYKGDQVSLVEKLTATVTEPVKAKTGYDKDKPGQIRVESEYYLVFENGEVQSVKLKEKDFKKALPSSKAVDSYLSDNKLKSVEDFKEMLEWYENQA